ncbi:MAG: glycosyltransferase family 2 protein [Paludibacteraceae bacterium]|nr:glycosyltransferase family 2 protein [Paludibacteraceae bacterium]
MDKQELISIIIPVYNIEAYLPKCLETIAAQTYHHLEIILVDDGSTDSSGYICDTFVEEDSRAIVIHQQNQGLWAARNSGQRVAKGDYLMFVDGDDYLHLDAVRTLYQAINNREYDIAIIDYKKTHSFDEDIESERKGEVFEVNQKQLISYLFNGDVSRNVWNKLYRKKLVKDIYANEYPRAQDYEFNIRVFLLANNAVIIQRKLYFWMQRPSSFTHQPDFLDIVYPYQVKFIYENYNNVPKNRSQYSHYLLSRLYKDMVFWKNRNYGTNNESAVFEQCKKYEKNTRKAYWLNWRINPIEKIIVTILLHSPRLTRWLMKVTKNN